LCYHEHRIALSSVGASPAWVDAMQGEKVAG
jgi:hypothetical protein